MRDGSACLKGESLNFDPMQNKKQRHVKSDSRLINPGDTFVAIRGAVSDGLKFVEDAIRAGAAEIVSEAPRPDTGIPSEVHWRTVSDARAEIARLACVEFDNPSQSLDVFGITGTNGKTTTAMLVRKILNDCGKPSGLVSTISNITAPPPKRSLIDSLALKKQQDAAETPATNTTPGPLELQALFAEMLANGCKTAVMEVSSHAIDQRRVEGTKFAALAFTNLTQDHLDYHLTMENYFQAKRSLFIPYRAPSAINIDCPYGRQIFEELKSWNPTQVLSYGCSPDADVRFSEEKLMSTGSEFLLTYPNGSEWMHVKLMGRHNLHNLLAAFTLGLLYGINPRQAITSLSSAEPVRGRLERVTAPASPASFFVDYAHTPDAIENVLNTLREITTGRLIIVFGAGGDRDRRKRPLMAEAASRLADIAIVTSDNPRSEDPATIIKDILIGISESKLAETKNGEPSVFVEQDRRTAIRRSVRMATQPGDVVLIAGKGHETYQIFADRTEHFDDREELMSVIGLVQGAVPDRLQSLVASD